MTSFALSSFDYNNVLSLYCAAGVGFKRDQPRRCATAAQRAAASLVFRLMRCSLCLQMRSMCGRRPPAPLLIVARLSRRSLSWILDVHGLFSLCSMCSHCPAPHCSPPVTSVKEWSYWWRSSNQKCVSLLIKQQHSNYLVWRQRQ